MLYCTINISNGYSNGDRCSSRCTLSNSIICVQLCEVTDDILPHLGSYYVLIHPVERFWPRCFEGGNERCEEHEEKGACTECEEERHQIVTVRTYKELREMLGFSINEAVEVADCVNWRDRVVGRLCE